MLRLRAERDAARVLWGTWRVRMISKVYSFDCFCYHHVRYIRLSVWVCWRRDDVHVLFTLCVWFYCDVCVRDDEIGLSFHVQRLDEEESTMVFCEVVVEKVWQRCFYFSQGERRFVGDELCHCLQKFYTAVDT